jgi:hypothetical protein
LEESDGLKRIEESRQIVALEIRDDEYTLLCRRKIKIGTFGGKR